MRNTLRILGLIGLFLAYSEPTHSESNRIWFTWEHQSVRPELCKTKNMCRPVSTYITRLGNQVDARQAKELTGSMDQLAKLRGLPVDHPDAPKTCQNVEAAKVLGFNPELWPVSEKLDTLAGLPGVYFSFESLKPPAGYDGPFGQHVQAAAIKKFTSAGIPILSKKELETTHGQPHLNIYFSNTDANSGCQFSIYSSLTQTALLTRNHTVKFKAGTWGFGGGYSADAPNRDEFTAIMIVIDKFIVDVKTANPNGLKRMAQGKH